MAVLLLVYSILHKVPNFIPYLCTTVYKHACDLGLKGVHSPTSSVPGYIHTLTDPMDLHTRPESHAATTHIHTLHFNGHFFQVNLG